MLRYQLTTLSCAPPGLHGVCVLFCVVSERRQGDDWRLPSQKLGSVSRVTVSAGQDGTRRCRPRIQQQDRPECSTCREDSRVEGNGSRGVPSEWDWEPARAYRYRRRRVDPPAHPWSAATSDRTDDLSRNVCASADCSLSRATPPCMLYGVLDVSTRRRVRALCAACVCWSGEPSSP